MLQIIGYLGCLYLVIKALEIASNSSFRDEKGELKGMATAACLLGWVGAAGFALWLSDQGGALQAANEPSAEELHDSIVSQCIDLAKTPEAVAACTK